MMTFSYVSLNDLSTQEFEFLNSINGYLHYPNTDELYQVYIVKDNEDIKSVFAVNYYYPYTVAEITWGTKEKDRKMGYAEFGFYMMMEIMKQDPSIKRIYIIAEHPSTVKLCQKYDLEKFGDIEYYFCNSNFKGKYDTLYEMMDNNTPLEELVEFCHDDEVMLQILKIWYRQYQIDNEDMAHVYINEDLHAKK